MREIFWVYEGCSSFPVRFLGVILRKMKKWRRVSLSAQLLWMRGRIGMCLISSGFRLYRLGFTSLWVSFQESNVLIGEGPRWIGFKCFVLFDVDLGWTLLNLNWALDLSAIFGSIFLDELCLYIDNFWVAKN